MSVPRPAALVEVPPTPPDFALCRPQYGAWISEDNCREIIQLYFPQGGDNIRYYLYQSGTDAPRPPGSVQLPFTRTLGACTVSIEQAGPAPLVPRQGQYQGTDVTDRHELDPRDREAYRLAAPDTIRGLAASLTRLCVAQYGIGGFVTHGLDWILDGLDTLDPGGLNLVDQMEDAARATVRLDFMTITVYNRPNRDGRSPAAGDTDPAVPHALGEAARFRAFTHHPRDSDRYVRLQGGFHDQVQRLQPGGKQRWWGNSLQFAPYDPANPADELGTTEMTYDCDEKLGVPEIVDCSILEFSKLGPPSGPVTVGDGHPLNLVQGTCALAVVSTQLMTIDWQQLHAAVSTLSELCVSTPYLKAAGGRARKGKQRIKSWFDQIITGIGRRPRKRAHGKRGLSPKLVDGSNALPDHVEVVLWKHDPSADYDCELRQVREGKDVTECGT